VRFRNNEFLQCGVVNPTPSPQTGGPGYLYAATDIALEFIGAHKPPHPATKCLRQGGDTIKGDGYMYCFIHFRATTYNTNNLKIIFIWPKARQPDKKTRQFGSYEVLAVSCAFKKHNTTVKAKRVQNKTGNVERRMKITITLRQLFTWALNDDHVIFMLKQIKFDSIPQRDFIKTSVLFYLAGENSDKRCFKKLRNVQHRQLFVQVFSNV
jgi:hypothetical protein